MTVSQCAISSHSCLKKTVNVAFMVKNPCLYNVVFAQTAEQWSTSDHQPLQSLT